MFLKRDRQWSLKQKFKVYFFTGLLVSLPILGSFWILSLLFTKVTDTIYRFLSPHGMGTILERMIWRSLALVILFFIVVLIGLIARNYIGKKLIKSGELLLSKIPVLNKIYSALKQILGSFWGEEKTFRGVVLVEFPRDGVYSIGFVTSEPQGEIREKVSSDAVCVFVPTAPNPTTGFLIFIPKGKVVKLDFSVEDAFKMILSSGIMSPQKK